jgi:hypothetical protein
MSANHVPLIRTLGLWLAWAMATPLAFAQAAAPFVGKWNVEWQTDQLRDDAVMVITETGGSWQTYIWRRSNPCAGREVQIQHDKATPNSRDMTLKFEDAIPGCRNARVRLQLDDKGTVTGQRSDHELQLKRV